MFFQKFCFPYKKNCFILFIFVLIPFICFTQEKSSEQIIVDSLDTTISENNTDTTDTITDEPKTKSQDKEKKDKIDRFSQEITFIPEFDIGYTTIDLGIQYAILWNINEYFSICPYIRLNSRGLLYSFKSDYFMMFDYSSYYASLNKGSAGMESLYIWLNILTLGVVYWFIPVVCTVGCVIWDTFVCVSYGMNEGVEFRYYPYRNAFMDVYCSVGLENDTNIGNKKHTNDWTELDSDIVVFLYPSVPLRVQVEYKKGIAFAALWAEYTLAPVVQFIDDAFVSSYFGVGGSIGIKL